MISISVDNLLTKAKKPKMILPLFIAAAIFIGNSEGLNKDNPSKVYADIVGVPTVCFGETNHVDVDRLYTMDDCKALLVDSVLETEKQVYSCLGNINLTQGQYIAFLSLAYNIGSNNFCRSTVVKKMKAGDANGACKAIGLWVYAKGRKLKGLVARRQREMELCLT
jgi:lysozyme